jgi:archaellum biogenesis ATPase FlaH
MNIMNPANFDRRLRPAAEFIVEHTTKYSIMPDPTQIKATTGEAIETIPELDQGHYDWFLEEFEKFTKRQELERAILSAADLLEKGEFDPVEKLIKDAVQISLMRDMGTDYFADPKERLNKYFNQGGQVSTGWPQLDRVMYGGMSRGELNIFAGGSGSGKSLVMMNLALNWLSQGLSGVYVTLELSEELTSLRTDAMLTSMSTKDIRKNLEDTALRVKMNGKKMGQYRVKGLPAQSNVNAIRSYIKEVQIQTGIKIDFVMIDYLDLVMPVSIKVNPNDQFIKDKYVSEELRNLAKELGVLMITASQLNRCLTLDTVVNINGHNQPIGNVKVGDILSSDNGDVMVTEVLPITPQAVYRITTKSGKTIECSSKHLFPSSAGLRSLENGLQVGDRLYSRDMEIPTQNCNDNNTA